MEKHLVHVIWMVLKQFKFHACQGVSLLVNTCNPLFGSNLSNSLVASPIERLLLQWVFSESGLIGKLAREGYIRSIYWELLALLPFSNWTFFPCLSSTWMSFLFSSNHQLVTRSLLRLCHAQKGQWLIQYWNAGGRKLIL